MLHGGLFMIEAELSEGTPFLEVEKVIQETIAELSTKPIEAKRWQKVKNQLESDYALSHMHLFDRADTLALATWVDNPDFFNEEVGKRLTEISPTTLQNIAKKYLQPKDKIVLRYRKK